jgi:hypothetical protein
MGLPDPNGTLARACYLGEKTLSEGDTTASIPIPGGTRTTYVFHATPNWMTTIRECTHGKSCLVDFGTPAPAGGMLRWAVWTA